MDPIVSWSNGLPYTATGQIAMEDAAVVSWSNGIPFTASGRVAMNEFING